VTASARLEREERPSELTCWAEKASELLLEIREHLAVKPSTSDKMLIQKIEYFLLNDSLPPKVN
jgi:hypothetical protein